MSHRITFATTEDRDKFIGNPIAAVPHCWLDDSPTSAQFVPMFGNADAKHLEDVQAFLQDVCPGAALIVDLNAPDGVGVAPASDPFVQTLIDNLGPLLESLPTVMHSLEVANTTPSLQLHIQKAFADKYLSTIPVTADAEQIVVSACLAGKHAAVFAIAMKRQFDLTTEHCDEDPDEAEPKPAE
jgi:hypothetical protein